MGVPKRFLADDFLLESDTARHLYFDYAQPLPLLSGLDGSGRLSAREIWENRRLSDLTQLWLGSGSYAGIDAGDPDKRQLMRANGVGEMYVTGPCSAKERLEKFAETVVLAAGNPIYLWCQMELRQFFGFEGVFSPACLDDLWAMTCEKLQSDPELTIQGLLKRSHTAAAAAVSDPTEDLSWYNRLDASLSFQVLPVFHPDRALDIQDRGFSSYMASLAGAAGRTRLTCLEDVLAVLSEKLADFQALGCRSASQILKGPSLRLDRKEAEHAYQKAIAGEPVTREEEQAYQSLLLLHLGREYHRLGLVMVLHAPPAGAYQPRDLPPSGWLSPRRAFLQGAGALLSELTRQDQCPRTLLPSVWPGDSASLDLFLRAAPSGGFPGKIQYGSYLGPVHAGSPETLFRSLAEEGILGNFAALPDSSRTLLPYAPHTCFRRIFCRVLGSWVERGEFPCDEPLLKMIVQGVCLTNALRFFDL